MLDCARRKDDDDDNDNDNGEVTPTTNRYIDFPCIRDVHKLKFASIQMQNCKSRMIANAIQRDKASERERDENRRRRKLTEKKYRLWCTL